MIALALAVCAPPRASPADPGAGPPRSASLARRLATLSSARSAPIRVDPALTRVAERHASELLDDPGRATRDRLAQLLAAEGLVDAEVVPFATLGDDPETLERTVEGFLEREGPARAPTHLGAGAARGPGRSALVVVLVRRRVALAPLPRTAQVGTFELRGRASAGTELAALRFGPCTTPERCLAAVEPLAVERHGDVFTVAVPFDDPGLHRVSLVADGDRGPETVALWTVAVGGTRARPGPVERLPDLAALARAIGEARERHELGPLVLDGALTRAASAHAEATCHAGFAAHRLPGADGPAQRARAAGFAGIVGENVALAATLGHAHRDLMASPGHRANVLDPLASSLGLAVAHRPAREGAAAAVCLVELFGRPPPHRPR